MHPMAILRLFAAAREAAGTGSTEIHGATVGDVLARAETEFGSVFRDVLPSCRIWVNGEPADPGTQVGERDEVAVLPRVCGGF
jgi:molybdopterin synthase sulfur carrier subunit